MSTELTGDAAVVAEAVAESKRLFEEGRAQAAEQLDLLGAPSPEQMLEARRKLGPNAGALTVLQEARRGPGRPKGARNRQTDDYRRFLLSHGPDPGVTMMQIQGTPPEVLMEASKRTVTKVIKDRVVTYEESMSYQEAQSLRLRAAEGIQKYINSPMPVAVDMTFSGVSDLIIEGVTHSRDELDAIVDADFMPVGDEEAEGGE